MPVFTSIKLHHSAALEKKVESMSFAVTAIIKSHVEPHDIRNPNIIIILRGLKLQLVIPRSANAYILFNEYPLFPHPLLAA